MINRKISNDDAKKIFPEVEAVTNADVSEIVVNAEIMTLIKEFKIWLDVKDGVEGIRIGKKPNAKELEKLKKYKPEIMEILKIKEEKEKRVKEEKQAKEAKELEDIKNGVRNIKITYYDGEILSGYIPEPLASDLLVKLGVAEYVSGWGTKIDYKMIEALGENFSYLDVLAYVQPIMDAKEKRKHDKMAAEKQNEAELFARAKETGTPQKLSSYTTSCNDRNEECDIDIVTTYAMPDGTRKTERSHTW